MKNRLNNFRLLVFISIFCDISLNTVNCSQTYAQGMVEHAGTSISLNQSGVRNRESSTNSHNANNKRQKFSADEIQAAAKESNKFYRLAEEKEKVGKLEEAKQFYYKSALARVHIWGDGDPAVAKISLQIGQIEVQQKRPDSARLWFKKSLSSLSKHYGPGDYELTAALTQLAKVEVATDNHEAASSYYQHILGLEDKQWGENSEKCVPTRIALIEQCLAAKDIDQAEKQLSKAIEIEKEVRGNSSLNLPKLEQLSILIQTARASDARK